MTTSSGISELLPSHTSAFSASGTGSGLLRQVQTIGVGLASLMIVTSSGSAAQLSQVVGFKPRTGSYSRPTEPEVTLVTQVLEPIIAVANNPVTSYPQMVSSFRTITGLTWEQLARVFGVSRRAVHHWANGGRINASNRDLLLTLHTAVEDLLPATPEEIRVRLLASGANGSTLVDALRSLVPSRQRINDPAYTVSERLDNTGGDRA